MTKGTYNRANNLRNRIRELSLLQRKLEGNKAIYCGTENWVNFCYEITPEMKETLLEMCKREIVVLEKEFEEL